jgi:hypothetical protein
LIGLWGQADDYGLFDWKPVGLKMRIAPADNIDASAILESLVQGGFIVRIERAGRSIGVVRSFRRWQRPKNPSQPIVEIDSEIASIIALKLDTPTPALPQPYPSTTENRALMEDVGDKRVEERSGGIIAPAPSERAAALKAIEGPCLEIVAGTEWPVTTAQDWHALTAIIVEHKLDPETELMPSIREQVARKRAKRETVRNWGYFVPGCLAFAAKSRAPPEPLAPHTPTTNTGQRYDRTAPTPMQRALDALKPRGERPIGSSDGRTIDATYEASAH